MKLNYYLNTIKFWAILYQTLVIYLLLIVCIGLCWVFDLFGFYYTQVSTVSYTNELSTILGSEMSLMSKKNIDLTSSAKLFFKADPLAAGILYCSSDLETITAFAIDKNTKLEALLLNMNPGAKPKLVFLPESNQVCTWIWRKNVSK